MSLMLSTMEERDINKAEEDVEKAEEKEQREANGEAKRPSDSSESRRPSRARMLDLPGNEE